MYAVGKGINPDFLPNLAAEIEGNRDYKHDQKQLLNEFKQFEQLDSYNQYKLWTASRLNLAPTPFQRLLQAHHFFIDDAVWTTWSVKSVLGDQEQRILEKAQKSPNETAARYDVY